MTMAFRALARGALAALAPSLRRRPQIRRASYTNNSLFCWGREVMANEDYVNLLKLASPESVSYPSKSDVLASRQLIRHEADVPVLLSAVQAQPDWLITHNKNHFTGEVAKRTKLQIGSPADFFRSLARTLS